MITYTGTVDRILYQNQDNAWSAILLSTDDGTKKASGVMPGLRLGMSVRLSGEMENGRYGPSLRTSVFEEVLPDDTQGIEKYLASGLIKHIGAKLAHDIVSTFGGDTLRVLDDEPERLAEVYGIGKKRVRSIIDSVREQKTIRTVMIWLKRYNLSNSLATKIYKTYGELSIQALEENPYRLSDDIGGVGFKKADDVARRLGIGAESPYRICAGIRACLDDAAAEGHTCLPTDMMIEKTCSSDYLSLPREKVEEVMATGQCDIIIDGEYVFLPNYYRYEDSIASRLLKLMKDDNGSNIDLPDTDALVAETGIRYSPRQADAIRAAFSSKVSIITGGPGTGKTITTNAIITEFQKRDMTVLLCAPTGRAAKRMNEVTGQEAMTIHRLLEYTPDGFSRNADNPLEGDALIVDEASMIDAFLMNALIKAIPKGMRLVIVGDVDQLPSVGAGSVLRDIIDSGRVPTTFLTDIYRQAQGSDIIMNAHAVNAGHMPVIRNAGDTDFWFFSCDDRERIADLVTELVTSRVPKKFGTDPRDIQVLTPMRKEEDTIGATYLNIRLQQAINPDGEKIAVRGPYEFRVGDRIMQVKNDYNKGIFNGDLGVILTKEDESDEGKTLLTADFDGETKYLSRVDLQNIELAYACTIHKSQGSEYPVVIIPVHESQYFMLKRNLLYTGITRARKECILVGTRRAIAIACQNEDTRKRYTRLKDFILQKETNTEN